MDDPERRKRIFNKGSFEKLKELNDIIKWTRSIKEELEEEDASLKALAEREFSRQPVSDMQTRKERWKIRLKLETSSNSIRPAFLKAWNDSVTWIKMVPVQGERKKDHLLIELTLADDIPATVLWSVGFTLSLRLIIAMNFATSGFWWWRLPSNKTKFYETIQDLQNKCGLELEAGGFQVFERRAALTEIHAKTLVMCLSALPDDPYDPKRGQAYTNYMGGLNFLALNCITWRCEHLAFGHFLEAFRLLMVEASYPLPSETNRVAISRFLDEKCPTLDRDLHAKFVELTDAFGARSNVVVKIDDVYLMKLLCEMIFRDLILPMVLRQR